MKLVFDDEQVEAIQGLVTNAIETAVKQTNTQHPYLNRRDASKYFGVAESTLSYWATLGMPVANIEGRKLYGKESITKWLKSKEVVNTRQTKKPQIVPAIKG